MESGRSEDEAQRIAAATYNKQRKPGQAPVTGHHSERGLSALMRKQRKQRRSKRK